MDWGYIAGYLDADGSACINKKGNYYDIRFASIDRKSLDQIKKYLCKNFIRSKIYKSKTKTGKIYTLIVSRKMEVIDLIFMIYNKVILKKEKLRKIYNIYLNSIENHKYLYWRKNQDRKILVREQKRLNLNNRELYIICRNEGYDNLREVIRRENIK